MKEHRPQVNQERFITESQFRVYEIICKFYKANGTPPSVREIATELEESYGMSDSTGSVEHHLKMLRRSGYLADNLKEKSARTSVPKVDLEQASQEIRKPKRRTKVRIDQP